MFQSINGAIGSDQKVMLYPMKKLQLQVLQISLVLKFVGSTCRIVLDVNISLESQVFIKKHVYHVARGIKTQRGRMFSSIIGAIGLDQKVMLYPIKKLAAVSPTDHFSVESR